MIGILVTVNARLSLIVLPPLVCCAALGRFISVRVIRYREACRKADSEATHFLYEVIAGVQALKVACAECASALRWEAFCAERRRVAIRETAAKEGIMKGLDGLTHVTGGMILVLAAPSLASGGFSVGDLALFIAYLDPLADAVDFFTQMMIVHRQADVSLERLSVLLPEGEGAHLVDRSSIHMDGRLPGIPEPERSPADLLRTLELKGVSCSHPGGGTASKTSIFPFVPVRSRW